MSRDTCATDTGGCTFVQIFATPGWRSTAVCYSHQYDDPERAAERSATVGGFLGAVVGAGGGPVGAGIGGLVGGSTGYAVGYTLAEMVHEDDRESVSIPVEEDSESP